MKRQTWMLAAGATALMVSAVGAASAQAQSGSANAVNAAVEDQGSPALRLTGNGGPEQVGDVISVLDNAGHASVRAVVVSGNGGRVVRTEGRSGTWGLRFPEFGTDARAVIRVTGTGVGDSLEPRLADFRFGAAWKLDRTSDGSAADDGDNLLQRGLAGDEGQFKLQLDHQVPMCTVKGDAGSVTVKAEPVQAGVWHRTRCVREGNTVSIRVWEMAPDGAAGYQAATESGPIGSVAFGNGTALSVGGKLDASGDLVDGSGDQFNGVVDNVVYDTFG